MGAYIVKLSFRYSILVVFFVCIVQVLGCGDSRKTETNKKEGKGAIALSIVWPGSNLVNSKSSGVSPRALSGDACSDFAISSIVGKVYTMSDTIDTQAPGWNCSDHKGTLTGVTPGQMYVVIEGYVGTVDDTPEWRGKSGPIQVVADQENTDLLNNPIKMLHTSDSTGPSVTSFIPGNGATNIARNTSITVEFNEPVAEITVANDSFFLTPSGASNPVGGSVSYIPGTLYARLDPADNLDPLTTYIVTVAGGAASGIVDMAGNAMANNYTWQFTTSDVLDTQPPTVSSHSPTGINIDPNTAIEVCFSEAMNPYSLNDQTFVVQKGGTPVTGTLIYQADNGSCTNAVTFTPKSKLDDGTVYTVTILSGNSGFKDMAGNALGADYTWNFTTLGGQETYLFWDDGNWDEKNWN